MSYLVLDRIKTQILASNRRKENINKEKPKEEISYEKPKPVQTPISPEELRSILMNELGENKDISLANQEGNEEISKIFGGIEIFVEWMIPVKDKFTPNQIIPLSTLIQVRDSISIGCGCRRAQRLKNANDYFHTFWIKNQETDLPAKVLEIGNFKQITFSTPEHGIFLIYPKI